MVVNITTIHFHYQVVTILGSDVHFNSSDVHYSVFTVNWLYYWNMEEVINMLIKKSWTIKKIKQYVGETFYSETLMAINIMI